MNKYLFRGGRLVKVKDNRVAERQAILINLALENDWVILCGNQTKIDTYKKTDNSVRVAGFAPNFTKHITAFTNGVLIDETLSPEMIDTLQMSFPEIPIQGGFIKE